LDLKQNLVDVGELSPRTWHDYKDTVDQVVNAFGKRRLLSDIDVEDFTELRKGLAAKYGFHRLSKHIQYTRSLFKHAYEAGLLDRPVRFGPGFKRPSKKTMRIERVKEGPRVFMAEEIRRMIAAAGPQLKAMILLGINCGFGNADCGTLPQSALDLDKGWVTFPRPKTGIERRCSLWPETVEAIKEALAQRPEPKEKAHAGLVFITKYGQCWSKKTSTNPISTEIGKLLKSLGINGHRNFYTLRHTFRTVADEAKDQPAADHIMGHEVPHMSSVYRERISDERLRAVAGHVRGWLFPPVEARMSDASAAESNA
jgi:integrase